MPVESLVRSRPHPENVIEAPPGPAEERSERLPSMRSIATGIICGLVGGTLFTGAFSTGFIANDTPATLLMIPLVATLVAIVCSLICAISSMLGD